MVLYLLYIFVAFHFYFLLDLFKTARLSGLAVFLFPDFLRAEK